MELAEIFRAAGPGYRRQRTLARVQRRAMRAIERCRTAALGGHRARCDACGTIRIAYNSCRNRHCPKCQGLAQQRWLEARQAELLPVEYFHVVFTLPHSLNPLAQGNPRIIYALLFQAASATLLAFGQDATHLGGTLGITAILHTWGQSLAQHIHLHCVVTGGALAPDGSRWIAAKPGFLFPVRALSEVFRAKYLEALHHAFDHQRLRFSGRLSPLADRSTFGRFLQHLSHQAWVVYCKPPFAGPQRVLAYLGRYTHRVALSNHRLLSFHGGRVRFRYTDYADHHRPKVMDLAAEEFLRRFLLHVLPEGFVRIRHFGLLANRTREAQLARCRALLHHLAPPPRPASEAGAEPMERPGGLDLPRCPSCQRGRMHVLEILPPLAWDTS